VSTELAVTTPAEARAILESHISATAARASDSRPSPSDTLTVALGRRLVPPRWRFQARLLTTNLLRPLERRRARRFEAARPLRLHPGCQKVRKEGWLNVDVAGYPVDLRWNLLQPLPFSGETVEAVFHEHLLEHFSLTEALFLTREWHRVLEPGGVLRIGVPDAGAYLCSYAEDGDFLGNVRPECATRMLAVQALFYWPHHQTMYDF